MHRVVQDHLPGYPIEVVPDPPTDTSQDIVIVHGRRTAICRAHRGGFKETTPDELLCAVMNAVLEDVNLGPSLLGDICVGNVQQPGGGAIVARMGQFLSGIPDSVPLSCVNRQCASGLQAIFNIAGGIKNGAYDIGLACGVESMSFGSVGSPGDYSPRTLDNDKARDCLISMGATSENVARRFGITREKQDAFSLASQQKAAEAQSSDNFKEEIVPVTTKFKDAQGNTTEITVTEDEGIKANISLEKLARLRPAYREDGTTTTGNTGQASDGAAAVLLASYSTTIKLGLPIMGVLKSFAVVGVAPDVMGVGPAYAIPLALEKAGLSIHDIAVYEINEAFASQAVYCVEKLGIPMEKVNPNGGAIALGHPLGCTGIRQTVTLLNELKRRGERGYGVVSMCAGTGMGAAAVFEYPGKSEASCNPGVV
ncbi:3-ketoacyl-CoA thiolase B, peroxisomal-like [Leptodactylus fuscus]